MYDHIVIGAGIQGSCTAYTLAKRGRKVLLVEQFPLPHSRGSSHGQSRIVRKLYDEDCYTQLTKEAFEGWDELEKEAEEKLIIYQDVVILNPQTHHYHTECMRNASQYDIKHSVYDNATIRKKYPQFTLPSDYAAVVDHTGGVVRADRALAAVQRVFVKFGGTILENCPVTKIVPNVSEVKVETTKGSQTAKSLIVCAGPWTTKLIPELKKLTPQRIPVCYWKFKNGDYGMDKFPVFMDDTNNTYGFPCYEYPGMIKIPYHGGTDTDPDQRDKVSVEKYIDILKAYVKKTFPDLEPTPSIVEYCMYTMTPDAKFILDFHPQHKNVVIGAGFSGTGFKMGPVVGRILADLAMDQKPPYDMAPFSVARRAVTSQL